MSQALTDFRRIAKEFAAVSDDDVNDWIAEASQLTSSEPFGSNYPLAMAYYAAHLMKSFDTDASDDVETGNAGPITQVKTGPLSETYADATKNLSEFDIQLGETKYGRRYLQIRNQSTGTYRNRIVGPGVS